MKILHSKSQERVCLVSWALPKRRMKRNVGLNHTPTNNTLRRTDDTELSLNRQRNKLSASSVLISFTPETY